MSLERENTGGEEPIKKATKSNPNYLPITTSSGLLSKFLTYFLKS